MSHELFDLASKSKDGPVVLDKKMMDRIDKFYQAGIKRLPNAAGWYDETLANVQNIMEVNDESGEDSDQLAFLFIDLLAATSPQTNIVRNTFLTTQIFSFITDGIMCKIPMKFEAHLNNVCRALLGLPLSGQKVSVFRANLLGDENAVTVDVWMTRVFNRSSDAPSAEEYKDISNATRKVAKKYGISPAQMQAALWVGIKALEGDPSDTPEPFENTLARFKSYQDAQGQFDFVTAEEKFRDAEESLDKKYGSKVRSNPGEGFKSKRTIGDRMREICEKEANLPGEIVDLVCGQPRGLMMAAVIAVRENIERWMDNGGDGAAEELSGYLKALNEEESE